MKYKKASMEKIGKVVNEIYGECKVLYLSEENLETLDANVTFEEYIKSGECGLWIGILLPSTYDMSKYSEDSMKLYNQYYTCAQEFDNLVLCGRLADFKYYNMEQVILRALEVSEE